MFASVEYRHEKVQIRINEGSGGSVLLAQGDASAITAAREIVDLLNAHFEFTRGLIISSTEGLRD